MRSIISTLFRTSFISIISLSTALNNVSLSYKLILSSINRSNHSPSLSIVMSTLFRHMIIFFLFIQGKILNLFPCTLIILYLLVEIIFYRSFQNSYRIFYIIYSVIIYSILATMILLFIHRIFYFWKTFQ